MLPTACPHALQITQRRSNGDRGPGLRDRGGLRRTRVREGRHRRPSTPASPQPPVPNPRFALGQESVKRAVTIAAAGGHNILLIGPSASNRLN
ncbi:MAG: hypothetical protein GX616_21885 [Planctomycetes bacterium]|nr:hypothetical protein [Planctomycetota bacterium]